MTRKKPRNIIVDGATYIWLTKNRILKNYKTSPMSVVLTLYLAGDKRTFFRLYFIEDEEHIVAGYPLDGHVWDRDSDFQENLNRPGAIAAIIRRALKSGWNPKLGGKPTEIKHGMEWIKQISFPKEVGSMSH